MKRITIDREKGTVTICWGLYRALRGKAFHIVRMADRSGEKKPKWEWDESGEYWIMPIEDDRQAAGMLDRVKGMQRTYDMPGLAMEMALRYDSERERVKVPVCDLKPICEGNPVKGYKILLSKDKRR